MSEVHEVTLSQFVESKWFKLISRTSMVLLFPAFISASAFLWSLVGDVAAVQKIQTERAEANDTFQASITGDVSSVRIAVGAVQSDVAVLKGDMQFIRGVLEEMRRQSVARVNGSSM